MKHPSPSALALAAGLALTLLAQSAAAQSSEAATPGTANPTGTGEASAGQTIVVTGSMRRVREIDAPYAIDVIDARTLRTAGPMINLSEAMSAVPGLVVNNRNNMAQDLQISARGFGSRAAFGVRGVRLYTDGIPATMPDGQGQVGHFDLAGASDIEVLRGPFSVLYGNSSGGVIALQTRAPTERNVGLDLDFGSFGLRQQRLRLEVPLEGGFSARATVSRMEWDGFRPHSSADRTLGNARLGWKGDQDEVVLHLSAQRQDADDPLGLTLAQFRADPRQTASQAIDFDTRKTIEQNQLGGTWRHRFAGEGPLHEASVTAWGGKRRVMQTLAIPAATQASPKHGGGVVDFEREYGGVDARLSGRIGVADVVAGVAWESMRDDRQGYLNYTGTQAAPTYGVRGALKRDEVNRATTREAYAQASVPLMPDLMLQAGVRTGRVTLEADDRYLSNGDDSGRQRYSFTNPVVGLRWSLSPQWTLHAALARGFESPTLGELAYRADGSGGLNADVRAQTSLQAELGAKWRSSAADVDAVVFRNRTKGEIGVATNAGGRASYRNVGRTLRQGVELSGTVRPLPGLRAQASLTWLDATYTDGFLACAGVPCTTPTVPVAAGNRIAGTQRLRGFAQVAWAPGGAVPGEFAVEVSSGSSIAVNDINSEFAPSCTSANLRWSHRQPIAGKAWVETLVRVENVTDRACVGSVIVNDANKRYYEPAAPRSWLLGVKVGTGF